MVTSEIKNYDWGDYNFANRNIKVLDTSLRDGLQDAQLRHPTLAEKEQFIRHLSEIGIDAVDIAIPIARGSHLKDAIKLARQLPTNIQVACLARTRPEDIQAAVELSQGSGRSIEAIVFIGTSPIRRQVEGWQLEEMIQWMQSTVALAKKEGLRVNVATEHTTESEPEVIKQIYRAGLESGGDMVCIADTTGAASPVSTYRLINFFQENILPGFANVEIDWHGHDDRGLSVVNSLIALDAGATRAHATALGIGERAGNTPIEQLLIDLKIARDPKRQDLTQILPFSTFSSHIFGVPIRSNYPGIGEKVGMTASGIHASAMRKAREQGMEPGSPYSRVDQRWFGRHSSVRIGPLSGKANVEEVADRLNLKLTPKLIEKALEFAQTVNRLLNDEDLINIANSLYTNGHTYGNH